MCCINEQLEVETNSLFLQCSCWGFIGKEWKEGAELAETGFTTTSERYKGMCVLLVTTPWLPQKCR